MKKALLINLIFISSASIAQTFSSIGQQPYTGKEDNPLNVKKEILADGSIAWLKSSVKEGDINFKYGKFSNKLFATINSGSVLFELSKNTAHKFTIMCPDSVIITGYHNSFYINCSRKKIEVAVLTGKVSLNTGQEEIVVHSNETAIFKRKNRQLSRKKTRRSARTAIIADTEYDMSFEDMAVRTIVNSLRKKFNAIIRVREPLMEEKMTINVTDTGLLQSAELIASILGASVKSRGEVIYIE